MPLLPCRGDAPFDPMRLTDAHRRANGRIGSSFSAASWTSTDGNSTVPQSKAYLQCERPCPSVLRYRATATADRPRSSMRARCPRSRETSPPPSSGTCRVGPRRSLVGSAVFLRLEMQYRTGDPCECLVASRPVIDEVADGKQAVPAQVAVERCERVFHGAEAPVDVPDHKVSSEGILCNFDDGGGFVHVVSRLRLRVRPLVRTECRFGKPAGWPAITSSHVGLRGPRACFSNFIEGTQFTVDEAADIVFRGAVPNERPADAHDILGTWRIVSDSREMGRTPTDASTLEALLKGRHATVMEGRPDTWPGPSSRRPTRQVPPCSLRRTS